MYLLKTSKAPGELLVGPFFPQSSIWSKFKYGPLGDIRDLDLVVSNQDVLYASTYKSMETL